MTDDNVNIPVSKIDYYSILKRRKRNIKQFIIEYNIKNIIMLNETIEQLKTNYIITNDFVELCQTELNNIVDNNFSSNSIQLEEKEIVDEKENNSDINKSKRKIKKNI